MVNPYDEKTSKISLANRFNAAFVDIMTLNPKKPIRAMAKPNSTPVRKKPKITARPIIPIVTSFIFPPQDF
jgi:hypothetical protein